ncbi:MAG: hypothetical protein ACHREM_06505 [Polyangiales bacterium]
MASRDPLLKENTTRALALLTARSLPAIRAKSREAVVWREGDDFRTMDLGWYEGGKTLVRVQLDVWLHYLSRGAARALGIEPKWWVHHTMVEPTRPKLELVVTPDEFANAVAWATAIDARVQPLATPPALESADGYASPADDVMHLWSARAKESRARADGAHDRRARAGATLSSVRATA